MNNTCNLKDEVRDKEREEQELRVPKEMESICFATPTKEAHKQREKRLRKTKMKQGTFIFFFSLSCVPVRRAGNTSASSKFAPKIET